MYRYKLKVENIRSFNAINDDVYFVKNNSIFGSSNDDSISVIEESCDRILILFSSLVFLSEYNRIIFSYPNEVLFNNPISKIIDDKIYYYIKTKPKRTYGIYELNKILIESNKISGNFINIKNFIYDYDNQFVRKINFLDEILWHFTLSPLGKLPYKNENDEVDKILGIAHGNLWFYTKAGRLIALDIETGEVTKKYSYLPEDKKLGYELTPGFGRIFFNEADENLYALGADYFHIINTKIKSIEEQYKHSISDPKGMGKYAIYSPLLQGDYFTFIAADQNSARLRFLGLFDIHKKQLVWEHELFSTKDDNELIAPEPLYMSGNKLYVKDFNSNLHIFERQD